MSYWNKEKKELMSLRSIPITRFMQSVSGSPEKVILDERKWLAYEGMVDKHALSCDLRAWMMRQPSWCRYRNFLYSFCE